MVAAMNEISKIRFFDSALAIAEAFPKFEDRFKYKLMLDVAKVIGERTPERTRAHIEAQAALAASVDAAIERGEVKSRRDETGKFSYQVGSTDIHGAEVDRWRKLAAIPDEEREAYYNSFEKWSRDALLKWWKSKLIDGSVVDTDFFDGNECAVTGDLDALAGQKFGTIYADPPWSYSNQGTRASTGNHYGTMSVADICTMPVAELAADNAHLHLWTTNAFLRDSFEVIEAWGFEYKSCAVWVKPQMGIGNYVRVSHEFLMIAVKGDCKSFKKKNVMSWFEHARTKHSAKPDYWRKVIEENSPSPRLELFGRNQVPGWTVFGNQISSQRPLETVS
jgi:N6-adenosine-specific RNA methylase IME4